MIFTSNRRKHFALRDRVNLSFATWNCRNIRRNDCWNRCWRWRHRQAGDRRTRGWGERSRCCRRYSTGRRCNGRGGRTTSWGRCNIAWQRRGGQVVGIHWRNVRRSRRRCRLRRVGSCRLCRLRRRFATLDQETTDKDYVNRQYRENGDLYVGLAFGLNHALRL